jgi:hypothetical protein
MAARQAIIKRAEGFVHQLECDLSRLDTALANVDARLAELRAIAMMDFSITLFTGGGILSRLRSRFG